MGDLVKRDVATPDALRQKRVVLAELERDVVERELDLSTLQRTLVAFAEKYVRIVGTRYAILDDLNAKIAEAEARGNPDDATIQEKARRARQSADESAAGDNTEHEGAPVIPFEPPPELKSFYRLIARQLHPDLGVTEEDRQCRHEWMAQVNDAYHQSDQDSLRRLLEEWQASPEGAQAGKTDNGLDQVIRKIGQVRQRIDSIERAVEMLQTSDLFELYANYQTERDNDRDLFQEMAAKLDQEIADGERELASLQQE